MASPPGGCWRFCALRLTAPAALTFSLGLCLAGPLCLALLRAMSAIALPPLQRQVQRLRLLNLLSPHRWDCLLKRSTKRFSCCREKQCDTARVSEQQQHMSAAAAACRSKCMHMHVARDELSSAHLVKTS